MPMPIEPKAMGAVQPAGRRRPACLEAAGPSLTPMERRRSGRLCGRTAPAWLISGEPLQGHPVSGVVSPVTLPGGRPDRTALLDAARRASLALVKLLENAFSTGQQVTTNAVYFKVWLPWRAG